MNKGLRYAYGHHWKEYILFNLCCFAVILGIAFLFKANLKPLHPIKKSLEDFSFTDIYYKLNKPDKATKKHPIPAQPELFVINIGHLNRQGLAELVERINEGAPAVLAMDVVFHEAADSAGTYALADALADANKVVQGYISADGKHCEGGMHSMAALLVGEEGFVNLPGKDPVSEPVRYFKPFHQKDASMAYKASFEYLEGHRNKWTKRQSKLHKAYQKETKKCYSKKKYTIRFDHMLSDDYNSQFLDYSEVLDEGFELESLKDKLVLLGFKGEGKAHSSGGAPSIHEKIDEDMYFTPLNKHLTGRSYPDMYGVDVQANIISNILRGNYIVKIKDLWSWVLAFLICLSLTPLMIHFFVRQHIWFHIVAKLLQLGLSIFFVMMGIMIFASGFYLNAKPILISIILIVDLMYFYDAIIKYIAKRRNEKGKTVRSVFLEGH